MLLRDAARSWECSVRGVVTTGSTWTRRSPIRKDRNGSRASAALTKGTRLSARAAATRFHTQQRGTAVGIHRTPQNAERKSRRSAAWNQYRAQAGMLVVAAPPADPSAKERKARLIAAQEAYKARVAETQSAVPARAASGEETAEERKARLIAAQEAYKAQATGAQSAVPARAASGEETEEERKARLIAAQEAYKAQATGQGTHSDSHDARRHQEDTSTSGRLEMRNLEALWAALGMDAAAEASRLGLTTRAAAPAAPPATLDADLHKMEEQADLLVQLHAQRRAEWEEAVEMIRLCWRALETPPEEVSVLMSQYRTDMLAPATLERVRADAEAWGARLELDKPAVIGWALERARQHHTSLGAGAAAWQQSLRSLGLGDEADPEASLLQLPVEAVGRLLDLEEALRTKLLAKRIVDQRSELAEMWAAVATPDATIEKMHLLDHVLSNMGTEDATIEQMHALEHVLSNMGTDDATMEKMDVLEHVLSNMGTEDATMEKMHLLEHVLSNMGTEDATIEKMHLLEHVLSNMGTEAAGSEQALVEHLSTVLSLLDDCLTPSD